MIRLFFPLILTLGALAMPIHSPAAEQSAGRADAEFLALLEEHWETQLREFPQFASETGEERYNHLLDDNSAEAFPRRLAAWKAFLARQQAIDPAQLSREHRLTHAILGRELANNIAEIELETHLIPITNRWGFHIEFPELHQRMPFRHVRDFENYIARLCAFHRSAEENMALLRRGIEGGRTLPAVVLEGFEETIEAHIVEDPQQSLLYTPLRAMPEQISEAEQARLRAEAEAAIRESVVPAYREFLAFMEKEYIPSARGTLGATALPGGRELYAHRVRQYTTLEAITPAEIHEIGLAEVARIRREMQDVITTTEFKGSFAEFTEHLRTDPKFYAETPEQLMKEVAYVLKRMDGELPKLFKHLPRTPYGIRPVPEYLAPRTTTAYYQAPTGDGRTAGIYYVNTFNLKSRPLYEIEALSLHEAVPGHHLQLALQQEQENLPPLRRYSGFTVFVEGWALYAERLGLEAGFYRDPYSQFGRLSYEMWRACRLVVDTGIHNQGWTREQAIAYLAENTALARHNIEAEVDRYISWPGQALAYKIGELKIRELRRRAEELLGPRFDLRDFHHALLQNGALPLDLLEQEVEAYIAGAGEE